LSLASELSNVIATVKAGITDKAGSAFPAADIMTYYEKDAYFNSNDREIIIEKGFQEWLLAFTSYHTPHSVAGLRLENIYSLYPKRRGIDMVILIANLIGGVTNETNRKN
jgi:hypothetical protein